eukprot:scaffold155058_cov49-Prasinocladus_malaysianus.AAC.1
MAVCSTKGTIRSFGRCSTGSRRGSERGLEAVAIATARRRMTTFLAQDSPQPETGGQQRGGSEEGDPVCHTTTATYPAHSAGNQEFKELPQVTTIASTPRTVARTSQAIAQSHEIERT